MDCTSLTSVEIPNSITELGEYSFYGSSGLTSVEIPSSVTKIGKMSFGECSSLAEIITLNTTPPSLMPNCFYEVPTSTCVLKVPLEAVDAYKAANGWNNFQNIVGIDATPIRPIEADRNTNAPAYNLSGRRVGDGYKGIVIKDGRKMLKR